LPDSQIFDFWRGPLGHLHEHWSHRGQLDVSIAASLRAITGAQASKWGADKPPSFG